MASYDIRVWEVWKAAKLTGTPNSSWSWIVTNHFETVAEGEGIVTENYAKKAAENAAKLHWHQQHMNSYSYEYDPAAV